MAQSKKIHHTNCDEVRPSAYIGTALDDDDCITNFQITTAYDEVEMY